jgi:BirA family transcriptional regulator, biotin operon repressor / biotin---[acetyl-CoA-carboxylase] ligase
MAVPIPRGVDHSSLLMRLADGRPHSGGSLARELGVSRAAVCRGIGRLREQGVDIQALAGRGYGLPTPVELLDARHIRAALRDEREPTLRSLEVLFEVDSTNTRLLELPPPPQGRADVCMSELQHAGRGRRGRRWIAPFGAGIAMSLGWAFRDAARAKPALSLAAGVAIARALGRAGARDIRLKWPNDVWFNDRKVGGVLLELRAEQGGLAHVVIGVGLNVSLSAAARREIEATGVRVAAVADGCPQSVSRNGLAGALLDELLSMLGQFEREGFAPFHDAWIGLDALRDRRARVFAGEGAISGTARGVDADGALLLESGGRLHRFVSGEVSLRLTEGDA